MDVDNSTDHIKVPAGYKLYTENSARLLLPDTNDAFLNPIQEFNRDLSIACIRMWAEEEEERKKSRWVRAQERKGEQPSKRRKIAEHDPSNGDAGDDLPEHGTDKEYVSRGITILEALSATGLRSIRYANEIPQVNYVLANDLSPAATEAMKRNVEVNGLGPSSSSTLGKVRVNEGDACALMYSHRSPKDRVDVVDLDPYGTAAPFLDSAVQCIKDDGLLCVTCTDLSVLAGTNYPEKCYANYGGVPVKGEYCHESALRLVLNSIALSAARYGRSITPLLSLSIDFYVRLFVRVKTSPIEVKKLSSQTSTFYVCTGCQSYYEQPLGRTVQHPGKTAEQQFVYKTHPAPTIPQQCPECDSVLHVAGPMWNAPIHDVNFVKRVIKHVEGGSARYGTSVRMKGMLTVASEELPTHFYFTPAKIAGYFRCEVPSLSETASALLNGGYAVSRSHAVRGSLKTTAPRSFIFDAMREWIKTRPVKMENIKEGQIARRLLEKEQRAEVNFQIHPETVKRTSEIKLVRYPINPTPNWGPKPRAKRKHDAVDPSTESVDA